MYVLEELWGDKVNLHEKGLPNEQYARAMQRLANCGEKLTGILNDEQRKLFEKYVDGPLEVSVIVAFGQNVKNSDLYSCKTMMTEHSLIVKITTTSPKKREVTSCDWKNEGIRHY